MASSTIPAAISKAYRWRAAFISRGRAPSTSAPPRAAMRAAGGVGVDPITENSQAQNCQHSSQQRPAGRQPRLQHPADGGAHQSAGQQNAEPGISKNQFAGSQQQSLRGKVHGHIGGLHGDVDAFEMGPHRWRGVGQSAVKEGIGRKQKAEVVRNKGQRNGKERKNGETQKQRGKADEGNGQSLSFSPAARRRAPCGGRSRNPDAGRQNEPAMAIRVSPPSSNRSIALMLCCGWRMCPQILWLKRRGQGQRAFEATTSQVRQQRISHLGNNSRLRDNHVNA